MLENLECRSKMIKDVSVLGIHPSVHIYHDDLSFIHLILCALHTLLFFPRRPLTEQLRRWCQRLALREEVRSKSYGWILRCHRDAKHPLLRIQVPKTEVHIRRVFWCLRLCENSFYAMCSCKGYGTVWTKRGIPISQVSTITPRACKIHPNLVPTKFEEAPFDI